MIRRPKLTSFPHSQIAHGAYHQNEAQWIIDKTALPGQNAVAFDEFVRALDELASYKNIPIDSRELPTRSTLVSVRVVAYVSRQTVLLLNPLPHCL